MNWKKILIILSLFPLLVYAQENDGWKRNGSDNKQAKADTNTYDATKTYVQNAIVAGGGVTNAAGAGIRIAKTATVLKRIVGATGNSFITDAGDSIRIEFDQAFQSLSGSKNPIQFVVDSSSALTSDTLWVWQNVFGSTVTIDSIHVDSSQDDFQISIVKCSYTGKNGTLVDTITASNNGTNHFYQTETTISSGSITNGSWIGFKRPSSTGKRVSVRIHYH